MHLKIARANKFFKITYTKNDSKKKLARSNIDWASSSTFHFLLFTVVLLLFLSVFTFKEWDDLNDYEWEESRLRLVYEQGLSWRWVLMGSLIFLLNHTFSFFVHFKLSTFKVENYNQVVSPQMVRIFPMMIGMMACPLLGFYGFYVFLGIKALVDIGVHWEEHKYDRMEP